MDAWYLVYSKARQEDVAFANLCRQGYTVYLPRIRRKVRGKAEGRVEPAFPRYLFIRLDDGRDDSSPIRSTRGVSTIVRFGEEPARVPDDLIAALRGMENEQGIRELFEPAFQPGDHVRIADGVLKGYEGILQANTGRERVQLLLKTAGNCARLDVHESQIRFAASTTG